MAKKEAYVVFEGRMPGVYLTWSDCEAQVKGFSGAQYKGYSTLEEAERAYSSSIGESTPSEQKDILTMYDINSISVDAACSGNPGPLEYRGVDTNTGQVLFSFGPFPLGTNNIGEFLALVHALEIYNGTGKTIYTDSVTAISWINNKKVSTNLVKNSSTLPLWNLIEEKLNWLRNNVISTPIVKWDTQKYGDIKADFGRK